LATTLTLTRRTSFAIELRRGRFEIVVDGDVVGSIEHGETIDTVIEPGHHALRIQSGRYSSPSRAFDVSDEEVVDFRCHGANIWPLYLASIVKPDLAISLKRR
jgi:hypothetical protein